MPSERYVRLPADLGPTVAYPLRVEEGLMTSFINPTLQQTASVAVVFGFTLLLPRFGTMKARPR